MRTIRLSALKAGQVYSEAVYIEDTKVLVPAGIAIRPKDIERLKMWGIEKVYSEGTLVVPERGSEGDLFEGPSKKKGARRVQPVSPLLSLPAVQQKKGPYRDYVQLIEEVNALFSSIEANKKVENSLVTALSDNLIRSVNTHTQSFIGFILGGEVEGNELAKSSVNTAILSVLMAMTLHQSSLKVFNIAVGALLHDVGMLRVPKEIVERKTALSQSETQRMRAHPLYTEKIISKELRLSEEVGRVALQHHERWDGEGYPHRLRGEDIELGARIISVADAFEAMVSEKPYRNSMLGYQAMKNLLSDNSRRFDPEVLKAFIRTMGIYPIGSIVLLNSGALARVTKVHPEAPLRPEIRILIDEFSKSWKRDEGELVDLLNDKTLFIVRAIDPREYSDTNG